LRSRSASVRPSRLSPTTPYPGLGQRFGDQVGNIADSHGAATSPMNQLNAPRGVRARLYGAPR
jgi:hypothetical protein